MTKELDSLDKALIRRLCKNGLTPVHQLAESLGVTAPTVRSRIKNLIDSGIIRIAAMINPDNHPELITALIGIKIQSQGKIEEAMEKLTGIVQVRWAAVVTGQYDIFAEVVVSGGISELHFLMTRLIPKVGRVVQTETFVMTKPKDKWIAIPDGLKDW